MKLKQFFLLVMLAGICATARAGEGREAILKAHSESGKVQMTLMIRDMDGPVSGASLLIDKDSFDLHGDCDGYSIVDLPNHILTMFFQEKGKAADDPGAKSVKVWAIPSSFVKSATGNDYNWKFKIRLRTSWMKETTIMDGTFEWNP